MAFWTAVRLQPNRTALALHCLQLRGFTVYCPRLRERRVRHGRWVETLLPLFPGYAFLWVVSGWWEARWAPGTLGLIMDGLTPTKVPHAVIEEIRGRERNGAVELPDRRLQYGDRVKILAGPFRGHLAIYAGMSAHERVAVLLQILGGPQRVTLAERDVEAVTS
jgi:transcriptional antiterminator RfaH